MSSETKQIDQLLHKVEKVVAEQKEIATKEDIIIASVATTEKEEVAIEKKVATTTWQRWLLLRAKKHELIFPLIIIVGVVLVWRGLWGIFDQLPIISYSLVSLLLGLLVLWVFNRIKSL